MSSAINIDEANSSEGPDSSNRPDSPKIAATAKKQSRLWLLPREALLKTGDVDHADWNYRPLVGLIQRLRFKLIQSLLIGRHYRRLLEVGYGSGVFLPELSRHCDQLFGIDPHPEHEKVETVLRDHSVTARLASGSAEAMPYENGFFDCIVIVSALEFIPDLERAAIEMRRILSPGGVLIFVTPGESPLLDMGLKLLTGASPKNDFGDRRQRILPTLLRHFKLQKRLDRPRLIHRLVRLYTAMRMS